MGIRNDIQYQSLDVTDNSNQKCVTKVSESEVGWGRDAPLFMYNSIHTRLLSACNVLPTSQHVGR